VEKKATLLENVINLQVEEDMIEEAEGLSNIISILIYIYIYIYIAIPI
jgi:hypothetical protein